MEVVAVVVLEMPPRRQYFCFLLVAVTVCLGIIIFRTYYIRYRSIVTADSRASIRQSNRNAKEPGPAARKATLVATDRPLQQLPSTDTGIPEVVNFDKFGLNTSALSKRGRGVIYTFFDRDTDSGCFWKMLSVGMQLTTCS